MSDKRLLLVDFSNVLMRGLSVHQNLSTDDGVFTGGVFGFMKMMASSIKAHAITHVVICKDAPPYKRIEEFGDYKGDRPPQPSKDGKFTIRELKEQSIEMCDQLIQVLDWPCIGITGYEADDVIAQLAIQHYEDFDEIIIMSNDSDMFQLLDDDLKIGVIKKKGTDSQYIYDKDDFDEEFGISCDKFITMLAITGTHNNVPGIHGIGPKKVMSFLSSSRKLLELNLKSNGLITRNEELIKLPHKDLGELELNLNSKPFNYRRFLNLITDWDFTAQQNVVDAFEQIGVN